MHYNSVKIIFPFLFFILFIFYYCSLLPRKPLNGAACCVHHYFNKVEHLWIILRKDLELIIISPGRFFFLLSSILSVLVATQQFIKLKVFFLFTEDSRVDPPFFSVSCCFHALGHTVQSCSVQNVNSKTNCINDKRRNALGRNNLMFRGCRRCNV